MGNHLAATAPSQILSVDSYLGDAIDYKYDKSLGSTRFMKVARVKHQEGSAVVKVFAMHDPNLNLDIYKQQVESIRVKLRHASNCLPFQAVMHSEKAALLFRQYIKHNLYDRISTRPFYNGIERRWVAFQLLCALNQMAKLQICHGDIKSENVMITSWNWLLLTDFASYKPTQVPDDNPADFNYFFDTSRRRVCYIAPERFIEVSNTTSEMASKTTAALQSSMDIFSAGCVIAELFTDGVPPFDFSQLLAFKEGKYYPKQCLSKIDDPNVRSLVEHMIQRDPAKRFSAEQYLSRWKGKAFPVEFYSHLKKYLGRFCEPPLMSADQTINTLHTDLPSTLQSLSEWENSESLIIIAVVALSCLRQLKYCSCKLRGIEIIMELAQHLSSLDILERIIPYLMELVADTMPRVRAHAFQALAKCASLVTSVPQSEVNVFSDFVFPGTSQLARDKAIFVRQTYAAHISLLAESSSRFLNAVEFDQSNVSIPASSDFLPGYDNQLQSVQETIQEIVQLLFSDADSMVRQCLLRHSVMKLCIFFGHLKCNDVILSHMITFLNDKHDWQLRAAFFDCLVSVAVYVGWQSTAILKPLLQQGLNDGEEFVICKTLDTLTSFTKVGLLSKQMVLELLCEAIPLLQHPCRWIRFNTIGFISESSKLLNRIEIHCHVLPKLKEYLTVEFIQCISESGLLSVLKVPVRRKLYEIVLSSSHIGMFLNHLQSRKLQRGSSAEGKIKYEDIPDGAVSSTFQKLISHGMQDEDEDKILNLCEFLQRQGRHRATVAGITNSDANPLFTKISQMGRIDIALLVDTTRRHAELPKTNEETASKQPKKAQSRNRTHDDAAQGGVNEEWKNMFGGGDVTLNPTSTDKRKVDTATPSLADVPISMSQLEGTPVPVVKQTRIKNPPVMAKYTNCKLNLRRLVHQQREMYEADMKQRGKEESSSEGSGSTEAWKPRGQLVAHMVEHRGSVNRIAVSPSNHVFATVSSDCTLKLWDSEKLSGKGVINQSKATWSRSGQRLSCVTFCGDDRVICSGEAGQVHCVDVENLSNISTTLTQKSCRVMDICASNRTSTVAYITAHGSIHLWDVRDKKSACTLQHDLHDGLMTSLVVDPKQHWLCVGTVSGKHMCWDLRFQLPITSVTHPSAAGVRRMSIHPTRPSSIISAVTGNNEVNIWDLETGSCSTTLWASSVPVLSSRQRSQDSVNGLCVTRYLSDVNIVTAGTDSVIRLWDVKNPTESRIISDYTHQGLGTASYDVRRVEGTDIIQEHTFKKRPAPGQSSADGNQDLRGNGVETCHQDVITDVAMFKVSQALLVSASCDGAVKLWK